MEAEAKANADGLIHLTCMVGKGADQHEYSGAGSTPEEALKNAMAQASQPSKSI